MENKSTENVFKPKKDLVHHILAHSYMFYFIAFIVGLFFDYIFPLKIFENNSTVLLGSLVSILGTILVLWAQKSSKTFDKNNITKNSFCNGPYRFTRNPTHWGLFFLIVGFSFIMNSLFIFFFTIVSFVITKSFFLKRQERVLEHKYGAPYMEYKKSVRF